MAAFRQPQAAWLFQLSLWKFWWHGMAWRFLSRSFLHKVAARNLIIHGGASCKTFDDIICRINQMNSWLLTGTHANAYVLRGYPWSTPHGALANYFTNLPFFLTRLGHLQNLDSETLTAYPKIRIGSRFTCFGPRFSLEFVVIPPEKRQKDLKNIRPFPTENPSSSVHFGIENWMKANILKIHPLWHVYGSETKINRKFPKKSSKITVWVTRKTLKVTPPMSHSSRFTSWWVMATYVEKCLSNWIISRQFSGWKWPKLLKPLRNLFFSIINYTSTTII